TKSPTQIVVVVDSDLRVPAELTAVHATVKSEDETIASEHDFALEDGSLTVPFSFGIAAGEDPAVQILVEVQGLNKRGNQLVLRRARTHFIEHETLLLSMFLARTCITAGCAEGKTCTENGCQPEEIDPASLP